MQRAYKKPDLNAPRYREQIHCVIDKDFIERLKNQHPTLSLYSISDIRKIITTYHKITYEAIIENRDGVELLEQLGYIFIGSCILKNNIIDYKKSGELNKAVVHQNWESDFYTAKIFYTNYETKYKFKFHKLWGFEFHRNFTRETSRIYKKNWKKYVQVPNNIKVSRLFRVDKKKNSKPFIKKQSLDSYNEFEI